MTGAAPEVGAPAQTVAELVARAARRRRLRTLVEACALGLAAAAAAVAAAQWSLATAAPARALGALAACALLSGAFAAGTWWVERAKTGEVELARRLDARLGAGGALCTAFEARRRGDDGPVALALERRATAGLDARALARALPAPGWIWLAPPALGCALAALAFEDRRGVERGESAAAALAGATGRAHGALSRAAATERGDPARSAERRSELAAAALALEQTGESGGAEAEATRELLLQLAREELRLAALDSEAAGAAGGQSEGAGKGAATGGGGEEAGSLLTAEGPDRRMVGSNRSTAASAGPPASGSPAPGAPEEAGTTAGRWWPERYDPVLQSWRRALEARAGRR